MNDVVVVSVGARSAVGLNARQTGFLLRAGYPAMAEAPLANDAGEPITMAFLPTLDGHLVGAERLAALACAPFEEAVSPVRDLAVEVHIAIDEGYEDAKLAAHMLGAMVSRITPAASVQVEARGEAAPGTLLPTAIRSLETRRTDVVVIGGVHSDYDPRAIATLEASGRLFSRDNLDARIPGEAAAFFVLMRASDAARLGLSPMARVLGVGTGRERATPENDLPAHEAHGLTAAVRKATEPIVAEGNTVGWILTDLTFEMWRHQEWQSVFMRMEGVLGRPYYADAPAQRIGYLGAAALPLFVVMAATGWSHGYAPAPRLLAIAGNDGGDRAAVVLGRIQGM
ncbi:3-oxoacyl-(acyl-carrier-protein) synthase [Minicystis rosea]|nr:3-oxoacyl-(acyl-carrier-protein) synthase [Minicystis rosea]